MRINTRFFSVLLAIAATWSAVAAIRPLPEKRAVDRTSGAAALVVNEKTGPATAGRDFMSLFPTGRKAASPFLTIRNGQQLMPAVSAAPMAREAAEVPVIRGLVTYSDVDGFQRGVYTIPTSAGEPFDPIVTGMPQTRGATMTPEFFVGFTMLDNDFPVKAYYYTYNLETGEKLAEVDMSDVYTNVANDLTYDYTTGSSYGLSWSDDGRAIVLAKYDFTPTSYTRTQIAPLTIPANMIAADRNGQLWIVGNGDLYKVDKTDGTATRIGSTGHVSQYLSSMAFDQKSDRLFMTVCTASSGYICEVNTATGAATPIHIFEGGEEVQGLYVPTSLAHDGAPAAARNLTASFPEGSLTGDITFDAPVTLYDDTAASGKVEYTVTADGELVARGNTMFGTKGIAVTYTAEKPGWVTFAVTFSNESGNSPVSKIRAFVGNGTPSPVRKATAAYDHASSTMNVSWLPVTTSADGGYIDPSKVTYDVYDADAPADAAPLAKDLTATEWSTMFPAPENYTFYSYRIVAYFEGAASGASVTNVVPLGAMTPAVNYGFDAGLTGWTVINANGDDYTWEPYNEGTVSIRWNSAVPMDDWLISMPLRLEAGKMYDVTVDAWKSSDGWDERFEIKYGWAPTAEAMTETLVPAGDLQPADTRKPLSGRILCENDGIVYIGLHGCSDADRYRIIIKDFKVSEGVSSAVPEACANLAVTPHAAGVKKADITFDAPTLTAAGDPLGALSRIDLKRDGKLVKSFAAPAAGASLTFTDEVATPGTYTYTVVACNSEGEGIAAEASAYIGFALPAAPAFATLIEGETVGTAAIAWAPVTEDVNGTPLTSADVTYTVCINTNSGWEPVVEGLVLPAYSYQAIPEGDQKLFQYAVFAVNEAGVGLGTATELKPLGTPYSYLEETFADCKFHYVWAVGGEYDWGLCNDEFFSDITSVTEDGGFIAGQGTSFNQSGTIYSAFMSLAGLENPALIFYVNNINGDNINTLKVEVSERNGDWISLIDSDIVSESSAPGWNRITCLLDRFEGKTIQFRLSSAIRKYGWLLLDDIVIAELPDHDLAAETIEAPATVGTGEAYAVNVTVRNVGANMAETYKVELSADGKVVKTFEDTSLKPGAAASFRYDAVMEAIATEPVVWSARVVYDKDLKADNDVTREMSVAPVANRLPVVTDLSADGIRLLWSEPDLNGISKAPVTVDFEDGESFAREYKDWTFVDGDGIPVGGFENGAVPGFIPNETTAAFFVFDASHEGFNLSFAAHSGNKYLASLYRKDIGTVDDWMISPEIEAGGQTISFYAKSYSADYLEKIRVCYSATDTDIESFVELKTVARVPADWTLYTVELPADAKYFAINSCATNDFMLMIDDVTFVPARNIYEDLQIRGYNVWRDGVKITETPVTECEYSDPDAPEGQSTYVVTVVYDLGESGASNEVAIGVSGLDEIEASLEITTIPGAVVVKGAGEAEVTVFSIDGKTVYAGKGDAVIPAAAGIYVVKAADKVAKVLVK